MPIYGAYSGNAGTADTTYQPSASLFGYFDALIERGGRCIQQVLDPANFRYGAPGATETYWGNGWKAIGTATNAVYARTDAAQGGVTATLTADNEYLNMNQTANPFEISRTSTPLAFEARVKFSTITDTMSDWFIGLGKPMTLTTIVPITTTAGDLATEDLVGFHRDGTDGDELNTVCCSADATHTVIQNGITTIAADTYVKIGFLWNPAKDYQLRFYVNGVESSTTHTVSATAGDTFPNNVRLGLLHGGIACGASPGTNTISWMKCMQAVPS